MNKYEKSGEFYDGLRLHQNENTGGCSPRVLEALATISREQMGFYPPYNAATAAVGSYLGVDPDRLTLLNGLDEGIMATAVGYLRPTPDGFVPEAVIPEPAFEIFGFDTEIVGGRPVRVAPNADFAFPLDRVLAAITPRTRVAFLTNPNNPTGVSMSMDAIRAVSAALPAGAIVCGVLRAQLHSRARPLSQRRRWAHIFEGIRSCGYSYRRHHRPSRDARAHSPCRPGLQREYRCRNRRAGGHRGPCLYGRVRRAGRGVQSPALRDV